MNTWVLVADARKARVFEATDKLHEPVEVAGYTNPNKQAMRGQNPPGHSAGASPGARSTAEPDTTPKEREVQKFAAELSDALEHYRAAHRFEQLILVAPPDFLGTLRGALSPSLQKTVAHSINKDLTVCAPAQLLEYVRDHLSSLR